MDGEEEKILAVGFAKKAEHPKPKRDQPQEVEQKEPQPRNVEATPQPANHILQAKDHHGEMLLLREEARHLHGEALLQEAGGVTC